jgi:hypothetical protein
LFAGGVELWSDGCGRNKNRWREYREPSKETAMAYRLICVVGLFFFAVGCGGKSQRESSGVPREVADVFGGGERGKRAMEVVAHPERVEAYRLTPIPSADPNKLTEELERSSPTILAENLAAELSAVLLDPESYPWSVGGSMCIPKYRLQFSFLRDPDRVDVLLCFECDDLVTNLNGEGGGKHTMYLIQEPLIELAHGLFPDDRLIQSITVKPVPEFIKEIVERNAAEKASAKSH